MSIQKSLKNAMLTFGGLVSWQNNAPVQYVGKQRQFLSPETRTFTQSAARYASDFVEARVQGICPEDPFAWQTRRLRMSDIVRPSAAILRRADNYKIVLFEDRDIEYIVPGSKIVTMGSVWIVANPFNVSGGDGMAIVERCNAAWNYLDWYGNVCSEPMVVTNYRADANASDAQEANLITKGYFNCVCQYNDVTRQIDTNTRLILGTAAYRVTGYSDFSTEFTGDYTSVRLLEFTVRFEEPNAEIDDLERHVAGGKSFSWRLQVVGESDLNAPFPSGSLYPSETLFPEETRSVQLTALSRRNGEPVEDTEEHPVSYRWTSSNENVAVVDGNGLVRANGVGTALITAALEQNPSCSASLTVTVGAGGENAVRFLCEVPQQLVPYSECALCAAFFRNGRETDEALEWTFAGADEAAYRVVIGPKQATVYGFGYAKDPLVITARHGEYAASAEMHLAGI